MNTVKIRNVVIGEGIPKICVPIVGKTKHQIIREALKLENMHVDIVEWRVDYFEDALEVEKIKEVLFELTSVLNNIPLLFTLRTANEGGKKEIHKNEYVKINKIISVSGLVDLMDVEVLTGDEEVADIIKTAQASGVKVIASNHDFEKTPVKNEIIHRLRKMQELGADILKIAVMPKSKLDVLELMTSIVKANEEYIDRPIVAVAMSDLGVVTRFIGEMFGSSLTFGSVGQSSAPGQIESDALYEALQITHKVLNNKPVSEF